ncbi:MAG: HAD family hydrolase [Puniceicoccales bacterium]|nr:HAD family hydrolase [Puniceicoccales bacterium]
MKKKITAVFFDLDGTLVDHFQAIHRCYCEVLAQFGRKPMAFEELKKHIGPPLRQTVQEFLGDGGTDHCVDDFCARFRRLMLDTFSEGLAELPGARWILRSLRQAGYRTALFTNKQRVYAEKICAFCGFSGDLDALVATDPGPDAPKKPELRYAQIAFRTLGVAPEQSVLVGDSETDFFAARAGNFAHCYLLTTGTHGAGELIAVGAGKEDIFPDLRTLGKVVFGLRSEEEMS